MYLLDSYYTLSEHQKPESQPFNDKLMIGNSVI